MIEPFYEEELFGIVVSIIIGALLCIAFYPKSIRHPVDYGRRCLSLTMWPIAVGTLPDFINYEDNSSLLKWFIGTLLYGGLSFWIGLFFGLLVDQYKKIEIHSVEPKIKKNKIL